MTQKMKQLKDNTMKYIEEKWNNFNLSGNSNEQTQNGQYQQYKQKYANNQAQKTAQTQRFIETVENAYTCVSSAALMYKRDKHDDEMVDILCDNAVLALNMFAVCCESLAEENNQDAIDLGTKRANDKFAELKSQNAEVYKLVEPHRKFMFAALAGQKNLRYKEDRVDPASVELFENNVDDINDAFARAITDQQKFHKRQELFKNPEMNKQLAQQHKAELNEYRKNKSKNKSKNESKNKVKNGNENETKYVRPKQSDLYFTKKGKNAEFRDDLAAMREEQEKKAMEVELNGPEESAYDKLLAGGYYSNAVLMLSQQNTLEYDRKTVINYPIPCQMLRASTADPENKIVIRMCQPYDRCEINVHVKMLQLNEKEVIKYEDTYIKIAGKLGYFSIREQQIDFEDHESNDEEIEDRTKQ